MSSNADIGKTPWHVPGNWEKGPPTEGVHRLSRTVRHLRLEKLCLSDTVHTWRAAAKYPGPCISASVDALRPVTLADASFDRRAIYINGRPTSDRFKVSTLHYSGGWRVLWIDRKFRFALTRHRLWTLGAWETDVGTDFTLPG